MIVVVASVLVLVAVKLVTVVVARVETPVTPSVLESVTAPVTAKVPPAVAAPVSVVAPLTERVVIVVVANVEVFDAVKLVTVVVAKVVAPVTPSVPPIVALPEIARLAPVIAPLETNVPNVPFVEKKFVPVAEVNVRFVEKWFVVVAFVAVKLVAVRPVAKKLVLVAFPSVADVSTAAVAAKLVVVALVKTPVEGVVAPIGLLSIVPPEIVRALTTIASVTELFGSESVFVTSKLPICAVTMVELTMVVVAKAFVPVKVLFAFKRQIFEASERSEVESPVMVAADTSNVFETVRLVVETFVMVALLAVTVPAVANVKFPFVANRFVPVALVQSSASNVPNAARRLEA